MSKQTIMITIGGNTRPIPFTKELLQEFRDAQHKALSEGQHTFTWGERDWCCAPDNDIARTAIQFVESELSKCRTKSS